MKKAVSIFAMIVGVFSSGYSIASETLPVVQKEIDFIKSTKPDHLMGRTYGENLDAICKKTKWVKVEGGTIVKYQVTCEDKMNEKVKLDFKKKFCSKVNHEAVMTCEQLTTAQTFHTFGFGLMPENKVKDGIFVPSMTKTYIFYPDAGKGSYLKEPHFGNLRFKDAAIYESNFISSLNKTNSASEFSNMLMFDRLYVKDSDAASLVAARDIKMNKKEGKYFFREFQARLDAMLEVANQITVHSPQGKKAGK